ncbi:MAG: hypothetical protein WC511_03140 [Candidatus Pacearchaeota archaeon]
MSSLYSDIIWDKLGHKDVVIPNLSEKEILGYFKEYLSKASKEDIEALLEDLVCNFQITKNVDWYDGPIHVCKVVTHEDHVRHLPEDPGWVEMKAHMMELSILPLLIRLFSAFPQYLDDIETIKLFVEKMNEKKPSEGKKDSEVCPTKKDDLLPQQLPEEKV